MRIALRTSGGRGEYELAGSQGAFKNSDFFGFDINYELTPKIVVGGACYADLKDGKPRIRLKKDGMHAYRFLSSALLMPKPIRELRKTGEGDVELRDGEYSIGAVDVDVSGATFESVTLRPTRLTLTNSSGRTKQVSFAGRMARVNRVWIAAHEGDSYLADLIRAHEQALNSEVSDIRQVERIARQLAAELGTQGDLLSAIEARLRAQSEDTDVLIKDLDVDSEHDQTSPAEATQRQIAEWRLQACRGAAGRRFATAVKEQYDSTCLMSGARLPRTEIMMVPGVDAAHILPWKDYDLDTMRNGLCLNKLCHWAFDNGLLRLQFDAELSRYSVSVPEHMRTHSLANGVDLAYFQSLEGPIPNERLPTNVNNWPSPEYLSEFNNLINQRAS